MQIVYSDQHLGHATDQLILKEQLYEVAEVPARAEIIRAAVTAARLGPILPPVDHGLEPILAVHDPQMIELFQTAYERVSDERKQPTPAIPHTFATRFGAPRGTRTVWGQMGHYAFDVASPIMAGTWQAAYWAAQCALTAADGLLALIPHPFPSPPRPVTYALCRPPGHHASRDLYGGYCYLNHAAIAARYLQHTPLLAEQLPDGTPASTGRTGGGGQRIAILDFDFHHGNGTQAIFYDDPSVLFCSIHADPHDEYPYYWGHVDEHGAGEGLGANRNFPLPLGAEDGLYLDTLAAALNVVREFEPACLVVSAGFDIFTADPIGGFKVSTNGLAQIGEAIAGLALPTLIVQEGGYLRETLGENAVAFLEAFL
jgi:acetoin utilization deacetylase AcuC-like enzyme